MRYILIIIGILLSGTVTAQFTGTDSLRNYNNRYITNNPATAFTNLRLHTLLRGMIDYIDTARAGTGGGGAVGVDTLWALNDSTIRYRKNGVFRNFILPGVYDTRRKVDTAYALNDSTLQIKINGTNRNIILPGRYWDLQGVFNNGSTLTENETVTLSDSLTFTSGMVIIDTLNLPSLQNTTDTTANKPVVVDASGNVHKMTNWPVSPTDSTIFATVYSVDTAKVNLRDEIAGKQDAGDYITALTGPVTATGPGSAATSITNNAITNAMIRQSVANSVIGRASNSTGNVADIQAATNSTYLQYNGTSLLFDSLDYAHLKNKPDLQNPGVYFSPAQAFDPTFVVFASAIVYPTSTFSHGAPIVWGILDAATLHNSSFFDSAYGNSGNNRLNIRYPTVKNVLNHTITPDESFAAQSVVVGATVGLNLSQSAVSRNRSIGIKLRGNGTSTWTESAGASSYFDVTTYNTGDGGTSFNVTSSLVYGTDYDGLNIQYIGTNNYRIKRLYSGLGAYNAKFILMDEFGNFVNTNPTSTDEVVISNGGMENLAIGMATYNAATNSWLASGFNWWVFGSFECWLVAAPTSTTSILVRWQTDYTSATDYKIYRSTSLYGARTLIHTGSEGSYTDSGLTPGTLYFYHMEAVVGGVDTYVTYFKTNTRE